ncbi:MAG: MarR family transcriptional regulator [Lachnospiraceae bacterium]|nr:MarR family transcriptional regulator [Lachnospiraceae bacterium]
MESLHYLLMKSHTMLQRNIISEAAKIGLTSGKPKVLDYLLEHDGSDQKTIAAYCEIEPATVGSILLRMENIGLIERRQKPGNRRSLFVYLTEAGTKAALEMRTVFEEEDHLAAENLSAEELQQLKEMLARICDTLEQHGEK